MDDINLKRKIYEYEMIHLRLEHEEKVIEVMSKYKTILNTKEKYQLKKLIKKRRKYPAMGITRIYRKSSE